MSCCEVQRGPAVSSLSRLRRPRRVSRRAPLQPRPISVQPTFPLLCFSPETNSNRPGPSLRPLYLPIMAIEETQGATKEPAIYFLGGATEFCCMWLSTDLANDGKLSPTLVKLGNRNRSFPDGERTSFPVASPAVCIDLSWDRISGRLEDSLVLKDHLTVLRIATPRKQA